MQSKSSQLPRTIMFKKVAADALGTSDICKIIRENDYNATDSFELIFKVEDEEKIYYLLKSHTDEYCFTNTALIHVDGSSAVSKRRFIKRLPYKNLISNVSMETAGRIDRDVEIKFKIGNTNYLINVVKDQVKELVGLYKVLIKIEEIQNENGILHNYAIQSLAIAEKFTTPHSKDSNSTHKQFSAINSYAFAWLQESYNKYTRKDFGEVFAKYGRK